MNSAGLITNQQWSHNIFNTSTFFSSSTYREAVEAFLIDFHKWNQESPAFVSLLENSFGSEWINKTAEFVNWTGL